MGGTVALHGGGEFLPGDEEFLRACLDAARPAAMARAAAGASAAEGRDPAGGAAREPGDDAAREPADDAARGPAADDAAIRVAIVPAASAGQRPDLAAAHGVDAFVNVAAAAGIAVRAAPVMIVDHASAASHDLAEKLAGMDLVHLPGGDPGRILEILDGSAAWRAILVAVDRGAVLAGASAGAMALAAWTWTPGGWRRGLGLVPGLVVVPHAERVGPGGWSGTFGEHVPADAEPIGRLGLDERTGVVAEAGNDGRRWWRVVGPGRVHWSPDATTAPRSAAAPALLDLTG